MRIAIVSDIHANIEALSFVPEEYDELWVLGDLVDYGPSPRDVIDFVRSRATIVVLGNHDHAVAFDDDPRCSPDFREMARATLAYTRAVLHPDELEYLSSLPLRAERSVDGFRFMLCHAAPSDPLYKYREFSVSLRIGRWWATKRIVSGFPLPGKQGIHVIADAIAEVMADDANAI